MEAPLAVGGNRLTWPQLPAQLRREVEHAAGAPVTSAVSQPGGFSPGLASVLRLADGRAVFVKAVSTERNPDSPAMHRQEALVLAALPESVPVPRLRWSYDDGCWVALMTDAVDGRQPAQPWQPAELSEFVALAERLADTLTPVPVPAPPAPLAEDAYREEFCGWRRLAADGGADDLDPWAQRHLDRLAELESGWPKAMAGPALLHGDLRADNVLLCRDGGGVVVDWPHACVGAAWTDLLLALPSVAMHGGGDPELIWRGYAPGRAADPDAVNAVLAAGVGFFLWHARQPPPPNLASVRAFQRAQGQAGLAWLRQRLQ